MEVKTGAESTWGDDGAYDKCVDDNANKKAESILVQDDGLRKEHTCKDDHSIQHVNLNKLATSCHFFIPENGMTESKTILELHW